MSTLGAYKSASTQALQTTFGAGSTVGATYALQEQQKNFLRSKFQVGSSRSDKITYSNAQKVFSSADCPEKAALAKKETLHKARPDILGVEKSQWNSSTATCAKDAYRDLKRTLLKVRAGLMDQPPAATEVSNRTDAEVASSIQYITAITGKGPIGSLTKQWCNPIDERGLAAHCVEPSWPDWNNSVGVCAPEDITVKQQRFQEAEIRRLNMNKVGEKLPAGYQNPVKSVTEFNEQVALRKIEHHELKGEFKKELQLEFPYASEERLQALAHRLLEEKLLADEKLARFPVPNESFRPNISITSSDRRYKEFYHPGKWAAPNSPPGAEAPVKQYYWSCCMSYKEDSKGCEWKIVNPDSWCYLNC